jgi:hypothetical protein
VFALTIVALNLVLNAMRKHRLEMQYTPPEPRRPSFLSSEITYQIPTELAVEPVEDEEDEDNA